jgi:alcohol dehydrogenase
MPTRIRFGEGITEKLGDILLSMGYKKAFIGTDRFLVTTPVISAVKDSFDKAGINYEVYSEISPDPTVEQVDEATEVLRKSGADVVIAVGGGSTIDTSKAICMLHTNEGSVREYLFGGTKTVTNSILPLICLPTTAGTGSEVTGFSVISDVQNNIKLSVAHDYIIPRFVLIDPLLHVGMPPYITATTGMDALTHAIEAYTSLNAEPISDALALQAIKLIADNLRTATANGNNTEARSNMAIASTIAGAAFQNGGLGVVHGIAQSMGGVVHISHGAANALVLHHAMKRNVVGNLEKFKNIAIAMGENIEGLSLRDAAELSASAVRRLTEDLCLPMNLSDPRVKVTKEMFPKID